MTVREDELLADALMLDRVNLVKYIGQTVTMEEQLLNSAKALATAGRKLITLNNTVQQLQHRIDGMQDYIDGEVEDLV